MKRRAQPWLGTLVDITINDVDDAARLDRCMADAFAAIAHSHRLMSFHDSASDVSRINRAAVGELVVVAAETGEVLSTALMLNTLSDRIFNIASASRLIEWGLLPGSSTDLSPYLAEDTGLVIEEGWRVRKTRATTIDLGGIAKGYAVDQAAMVLQRAGIQSACINAGGDLRVIGVVPFIISVRDPATITGTAHKQSISNAAMATSASYFSKRLYRNQLVSALIDGRTGNAVTDRISVSVMAPTCLFADALTNIIIASGDAQHPILDRFGAQAFIIKESVC